MAKAKKRSILVVLKEELAIIQERTSIYNNVVDQVLKKVSKKYGRLNATIDDPQLSNEMNDNDKRFIDILTSMIALEEKIMHDGKRKYAFIYNQYARMVDRTASSMTKKLNTYTMNFCLRRGMVQNVIIIKKLMARVDGLITKEEKK